MLRAIRIGLRFFVMATLTVAGITAYAEVVTDMYEATITVKTQERQDRDEAIRTALAQVLVRVSGRTQIADSDEFPRIKAALVNATNYAQQFRYRDKSQQKYLAAGESALELWVKFDPVVVNKLLRENNIPLWDKNRPTTLVWLVSDERAHREILGQASTGLIRSALDDLTHARGLPVILPKMDLTDRNAIQVSQVWNNNAEAIQAASARYSSDAILVGRLQLLPSGQWNTSWSLLHEGRKQEWSTSNVALTNAVSLGIDQTSEYLSQRFAHLVQGEDSLVLVQVKNIRTLTDFNRTVKFLRTLSQVKSVSPQLVQGENVVFRVNTSAGRLGLAHAISLSAILNADSSTTTTSVSPSPSPTATTQSGSVTPELVYLLAP